MLLTIFFKDEEAPLPHVYDELGWTAIKYIVSVGAMCGLFSRYYNYFSTFQPIFTI